jgi:hypothetical protein
MRIPTFPLHKRYIHCSTRISLDIIKFDWFEITCLLPKSAAVIKAITLDWAGVVLATLSCKVPYLNSNFRVVTPWTAWCGLCFPTSSVSGTITYKPYVIHTVWCMGGWLVLGLWAIVPLLPVFQLDTAIQTCNVHSNMLRLVKKKLTRCIHIKMNSTNPWIHLFNEFIYNWKSPISDNRL